MQKNIEGLVQERKGMIVIGMISSGKSTFLNSIFGFNYLQANDNITTKFICIIRYNPKLKQPKFYKLKLLQKQGKQNEYIYLKEGKDFLGKKEIKDKIKSINFEQHKSSEPIYENLFWMLEINEIPFENKKFMEEHDFYDIPGLNEYMTNEGDIKLNNENQTFQENPEENNIINQSPAPIRMQIKNQKQYSTEEKKYYEDFKYIRGIFKYLKGKIENFIFIISSDSCYKPINIEIIKEVRKNIDFDYEGGLFILTKIDLSDNKEKKIEECKQFFINNMPSDIFNIHFNVFIPLNSKNFKIEMFMKTNIKYYFLYFYRKYYDEFVCVLKENKTKNKIFIEYIEEIIKNLIGEEKYNDFIDEASEEIKMNELQTIKKVYEKIKKEENRLIEFGIDFDDEDNDSINILKAFYKLYINKQYFPPLSENTKEIIKYFNDYLKPTPKQCKNKMAQYKELNEIDKNLENLEQIFNEIKMYIEEDKNDIHSTASIINNKLRRIKKYIKNGLNIYIPFIGISSAGKSSILNCLIGYNLFPESDRECTTRGIIIKYGKKVKLYEVKIESENNFYIFEKDKLISQSVEKVQEYLKCLNYQYGKDESKYFYLIKTPIKYFDDYKFTPTLKKKIFLIDLPGCDTLNNKFNEHYKTERTPYEKLIDISSSFVFINRGRKICDTTNKKLLNQAYNIINDNTSLGANYIKNCLFVINMFQPLTDKEKDISDIKKDISHVIFENIEDQQKYHEIIHASLFDAKAYMEYLNENERLCNKKNLFIRLKKEFIEKKRQKFSKFCLLRIKTICKDISLKIDNNYEGDPLFYEDIKNEIILIMNDLNMKCDESDFQNIKKISNSLQYITIKMKENKFFLNSNCLEFFKNLENQILKAKNHSEQSYNNNLEECFKYFDLLFEKDIDPKKTKNHQAYIIQVNAIIEQLNKLEEAYQIEKIFDKYLDEILNIFEYIKVNQDELAKKYDNKIEELIQKELKDKSEEILQNLNDNIEKTMQELDNEVIKIRNKLIELFKKGLKNEMKKEKYQSELKILVKFSFYEKMKLKICNLFPNSGSAFVNITLVNALFAFLISMINPFCLIANGVIFLLSLGFFFFSKNKEKNKLLVQKLDECKEKCEINFSRMRTKFARIYKDTLIETKNKFEELLSLSCVDLSKIEKKKWKILNEKYLKIENNIKKLSMKNNNK